jgi:hypothetical protein
MLCIALALGQVGADADSGKKSTAAQKKKTIVARAKAKHAQDAARTPAEHGKKDPRRSKQKTP